MKTDIFLYNKHLFNDNTHFNGWVISPDNSTDEVSHIFSPSTESTDLLIEIANKVTSDYFFLQVKTGNISFDDANLIEWLTTTRELGSALSYCHYWQHANDEVTRHNVIEYTEGSIRDDFNVGALVLIKTSLLHEYIKNLQEKYLYAGWYSFRLFLSRKGSIELVNNYAYSTYETDLRASGVKQFDYVNPNNRDRQIEMEKATTHHLQQIGALVKPPFNEVNLDQKIFPAEASVIIPVLNREKTIADAIKSVLAQQTDFTFNLIIVNNHSTDDTARIINTFDDRRIIHHVPQRTDLGIGGCWNEAINHEACGKFAIQLDSDDLYLDETTLQKIVDEFRRQRCAMVIGSYRMVNFNLEEIPPGVIDHREWSDNNGPNNALRINGLGAPRAFFTPIIRQLQFPNVSYGEDYAVAIAISRQWKIGRIYEPIYLCRRWDNNTDSNLSIEKINQHNRYKDKLRTSEIRIRKTMSSKIVNKKSTTC